MQRFEIPKSFPTFADLSPLRSYFISCIQAAGEGLVIKGAGSRYIPGRRIWFKMKPDYMRGLGDTAEYCILGGSYVPSASKFLKITQDQYPSLMNTFYVGVILNKKQIFSYGVQPDFRIIFTFEAGFSRESLIGFSTEMREVKLKNTGDLPLNYSYGVERGLGAIDYFFPDPILVSLKGSSFVRIDGIWVLRHPRLVRFCGIDRSLRDVMSFAKLQELGKESTSFGQESVALELQQFIEQLDRESLAKEFKLLNRKVGLSILKESKTASHIPIPKRQGKGVDHGTYLRAPGRTVTTTMKYSAVQEITIDDTPKQARKLPSCFEEPDQLRDNKAAKLSPQQELNPFHNMIVQKRFTILDKPSPLINYDEEVQYIRTVSTHSSPRLDALHDGSSSAGGSPRENQVVRDFSSASKVKSCYEQRPVAGSDKSTPIVIGKHPEVSMAPCGIDIQESPLKLKKVDVATRRRLSRSKAFKLELNDSLPKLDQLFISPTS
jgi:hypothetical protein